MLPTDIEGGFSSSVWFPIAAALFCAGAAWLFYRYTLPALHPARRLLMSVLRGASLTLLAILIFEPVIRFVSRTELPATVAVLIDDSQSMALQDRGVSRDEQLKRWLDTRPLSGLPGDVRVAYFRFSQAMHPLPGESPAESLGFKGETTDLASALENIGDLAAVENIRSLVIVSDGITTIGKNPLYSAEALGFPVFTVGVGDTAEQKDLLIARAFTNDVAYAGSALPFDITVKSSGYGGERVEVTLLAGTTVTDRELLTLELGVREYRLRMEATPSLEGSQKYTVTVSRLDGELTVRNNSQSLYVKVLKSKLRILLIAGAPGPDVSVVRQLLAEDPHFTVMAFIQRQGGAMYGGTPDNRTIDSADCLVLINFPTATTTSALLQVVQNAFTGSKKPLLFVGGSAVDEARLKSIESVLPFTVGAVGPMEMMVVPGIPERARTNPLIHLSDMIAVEEWRRLPPVYVRQSVVRLKPESEALISMMFQNVQMNDPLIAVRNVNRQKSIGIAGYGIWRWQLLTQGTRDGERILPAFLASAVRWLATQDEKKNVRIAPVKDRFSSSEPVEFTAQVYDVRMRPAERADVTLELKKGSEIYGLTLNDIGNGRYEGSLQGIPEGEYAYRGSASTSGQMLGEDGGTITVGQTNVEFLETRMNKPLLEQIAFRTGGSFTGIQSGAGLTGEVASKVDLNPREKVHTSEIEVWNWSTMVSIIVLLLSLEWFLRKRMGML